MLDYSDGITAGLATLKFVTINSLRGVLVSGLAMVFMVYLDKLMLDGINLLSLFELRNCHCTSSQLSSIILGLVKSADNETLNEIVGAIAGVLGLILGLFYTAFLTIISTQYASLNGIIRSIVVNQETLNRYFYMLSFGTAFSLWYLTAITFGYSPTRVSILILTMSSVSFLFSFIFFGKRSLIYFDIGVLVNDILFYNYSLFKRAVRQSNVWPFVRLDSKFLDRIYTNSLKIELLLAETERTKTVSSIEQVTTALLRYLVFYSFNKHKIPSDEEWQIKVIKERNWDEARDIDYSLLESSGIGLIASPKADVNVIEKYLHKIQFKALNLQLITSGRLDRLQFDSNYLQLIAIGLDVELIKDYFEHLSELLFRSKDPMSESESNGLYNGECKQFVELMISVVLGFQNNLASITSAEFVSEFVDSTHNGGHMNRYMPYKLRPEFDFMVKSLIQEAKLEEVEATRDFYIKFFISSRIAQVIDDYWNDLLEYFVTYLKNRIRSLSKSDHSLSSLFLAVYSMETLNKMTNVNRLVEKKIDILNEFNYQFETDAYESVHTVKNKNLLEQLRNEIIRSIFQSGVKNIDKQVEGQLDAVGTGYVIIRAEIERMLFEEGIHQMELSLMLRKYFGFAFLYLQSRSRRYEHQADIERVVYPIIRDVMDIFSISVLLSLLKNKQGVIESLLNYANRVHRHSEDELEFWRSIMSIYYDFKDNRRVFANVSYQNELARKKRLREYITDSENVDLVHSNDDSIRGHSGKYVSKLNDDVYLRLILNTVSPVGVDDIRLDEFFIEYYLRTRLYLKGLNLKETRFAKRLSNELGKDN